MKINIFKRLKNFFKTTFIGGLVALLPISLVVILFRWIIGLVEKYLGPLIGMVETDSQLYRFGLYLLALIGIFLLFFFIGLIIKTSWGNFIRNGLERRYLSKVPGYKLAKETVSQFFGKNRSFFSEVVLVDLFNSGTLMTGFITDDQGEIITVFVPTGPNPTSGNIYHVPADKVTKTTAHVDAGMKSIISCGAGSAEVFESKLSASK
jgi:uncharacterized membrane protein